MGVGVMVLGKSGSGKSMSLRNFDPKDVGLFNVVGKPLPFKGGNTWQQVRRPKYADIERTLTANNLNAYVIDDSTYMMQFDNFRRALDTGYTKFTEMAVSFERLLETAMLHTNDDTIVYFMHHPDIDDNGGWKPKTIGKMLDEKLCIEGMFPVVIECVVRDGAHLFVTTNEGIDVAKCPPGALPAQMDNDLALVDQKLREFWGMKKIGDNSAKKKED